MSRRVLILGANGQLGTELLPLLSENYQVFAPNRRELDLSNPDSLKAAVIKKFRPELIVNAAAYTNVEGAERERSEATALNEKLPETLSLLAKHTGCRLIHYSSDYVLSGTGNMPQTEEAECKALNWYGKTKAAGDKAIIESGCDALILRTSWVYSHHHVNFLTKIIRLAGEVERLSVVNDQFGTPTQAHWLAQKSIELLGVKKNKRPTIINVVPNGYTSWWGFACLIVKEMEKRSIPMKCKVVIPCESSKKQNSLKRPRNSKLENKLLSKKLAYSVENWQLPALETMAEITQTKAQE